jgi:hypothetical protein
MKYRANQKAYLSSMFGGPAECTKRTVKCSLGFDDADLICSPVQAPCSEFHMNHHLNNVSFTWTLIWNPTPERR